MNNKGDVLLTEGTDYIESLLTSLTVAMNRIAIHSSLFNRK
jgi:hypothetical protein